LFTQQLDLPAAKPSTTPKRAKVLSNAKVGFLFNLIIEEIKIKINII
jgi:hypothetical protein